MGGTLTLVDLAGFVALLLWGVRMVQTGIQRAFGADLHPAAAGRARRPVQRDLRRVNAHLAAAVSDADAAPEPPTSAMSDPAGWDD